MDTGSPPGHIPRWRNEVESDVSDQLPEQSNSGNLLPFYPAVPSLKAYKREAVPVTLTLDLLGCWVCDLLKIVQQSLTRASLTAFTSLIKTVTSASFLPYQFYHIFLSSFWALHQLHLLPLVPHQLPLQRCWFPLCDSILRSRTWVVNSKLLEQQPWLPQQLSECCCSALKLSSYCRIANANRILQWPSQLTELATGQRVLCCGRYGRKKPCTAGTDLCMRTPLNQMGVEIDQKS